MKICAICNAEKAINEFHRASRGGWMSVCKKCDHQRRNIPRHEKILKRRAEKEELLARGLKVCKSCKETKTVDEFYASPQCFGGCRGECIVCVRKKSVVHWHKPETVAARKEYFSREDVRERQNSHRRSEKGRKQFRERVKRTPSYVLSFALHRALKRRPTDNPVTHSELIQLYRDQNGKCALSGKTMTWMNGRIHPTSITIDRIDSTKGYTRGNIQLLCHSVNRMKGDATEAEVIEIARAIVANSTKPPLWGETDTRCFSLQ